MDIHGLWYNGKDASRCEALLRLQADGQVEIVAQSDGRHLCEAHASTLEVSSRLGNSARFVRFSGGAAFETTENAQVDELQRQWQPGLWRGLLHRLETHLGLVIAASLVVLVLVVGGALYGVPAVSKTIAYQLPQDTLDSVASESMSVLDKFHFEPSQLSQGEKNELHQAFAPVLADYPELDLRVEFRTGGEHIGANAFALPDGTMIFTDEMVALSHSHDELRAVLAHEIGHVALRHSLRAVIQNAVLGFAYVTLVGDGSAVGDLLVGLPVLATTLSYSRDHETEADEFAARYLDKAGIDRRVFVDLMTRLGETAHCQHLLDEAEDVEPEQLSDTERLQLCEELAAQEGDDESAKWLDYLSTHPNLDKRLEDFTR